MADRRCVTTKLLPKVLVDRFGKFTVSRVGLLLFYDFIDSQLRADCLYHSKMKTKNQKEKEKKRMRKDGPPHYYVDYEGLFNSTWLQWWSTTAADSWSSYWSRYPSSTLRRLGGRFKKYFSWVLRIIADVHGDHLCEVALCLPKEKEKVETEKWL